MIHWHLHSHYSVLDGLGKVADIVAKVSGAYCDIFKRIVGKSIDEYVSDVYAD